MFCFVIATILCKETFTELAEAPTWKPAATIGTSIAAASVIDRPKLVAAAVISGKACAMFFKDKVVWFSIKLNIAICPLS